MRLHVTTQLRWVAPSASLTQHAPEQIVTVDVTTSTIESIAAAFEREVVNTGHALSPHVSSLVSTLTGSNSIKNSAVQELVQADANDTEAPVAQRRKLLSTESVLANCARQKKRMLEDVRALQRAFWTQTQRLWTCVSDASSSLVHPLHRNNMAGVERNDQQQPSAFVCVTEASALASASTHVTRNDRRNRELEQRSTKPQRSQKHRVALHAAAAGARRTVHNK